MGTWPSARARRSPAPPTALQAPRGKVEACYLCQTMEHQTKYSHNTQAHIKISLEYSPGVTTAAHKGTESAPTAKN